MNAAMCSVLGVWGCKGAEGDLCRGLLNLPEVKGCRQIVSAHKLTLVRRCFSPVWHVMHAAPYATGTSVAAMQLPCKLLCAACLVSGCAEKLNGLCAHQ